MSESPIESTKAKVEEAGFEAAGNAKDGIAFVKAHTYEEGEPLPSPTFVQPKQAPAPTPPDRATIEGDKQ